MGLLGTAPFRSRRGRKRGFTPEINAIGKLVLAVPLALMVTTPLLMWARRPARATIS